MSNARGRSCNLASDLHEVAFLAGLFRHKDIMPQFVETTNACGFQTDPLPNREFIAAKTQFEVSRKQITSDNVGAGVLARAGATGCRCEHGKANCNYDDCSSDLNAFRSRDRAVKPP